MHQETPVPSRRDQQNEVLISFSNINLKSPSPHETNTIRNESQNNINSSFLQVSNRPNEMKIIVNSKMGSWEKRRDLTPNFLSTKNSF